jgi:CheY-like chemotaxis protein
MATDPLAGLRLLVVEDEAMIALALEDMLDALGCKVVGVGGTLRRGLAMARDDSLPMDGAILDVNLGGEPVYPIAKALAARGVPFVFCTGYGSTGVAAEFAHVPALAKPYEQQQLRDLLLACMLKPARS